MKNHFGLKILVYFLFCLASIGWMRIVVWTLDRTGLDYKLRPSAGILMNSLILSKKYDWISTAFDEQILIMQNLNNLGLVLLPIIFVNVWFGFKLKSWSEHLVFAFLGGFSVTLSTIAFRLWLGNYGENEPTLTMIINQLLIVTVVMACFLFLGKFLYWVTHRLVRENE